MRKIIALAVICATAVMSFGVVSSPASATGYRPCSEPLNSNRQAVYRFKNGDDILPFGRVVVTATKQYPNRYCERFDIGGRFLEHIYKRADYERREGVCTGEKFRVAAGGPYEVSSYRQGLTVPNRACTFQAFSVKWEGKWWTARVKRENP